MKSKLTALWIFLSVVVIYLLLNTYVLTPIIDKLTALWN